MMYFFLGLYIRFGYFDKNIMIQKTFEVSFAGYGSVQVHVCRCRIQAII